MKRVILVMVAFAGAVWAVPSAGSTEELGHDQERPPLGIIDLYGLRRVSEAQVREALHLNEGDPLPAESARVEKRLEAIPGVACAHLDYVCCDAGRSILFVGIEEAGAGRHRFRTAPQGSMRLPDDVVRAGEEFDAALMDAVRRGDAAEEPSQGYSLMHDPKARTVQERFVGFAARDFPLLRTVLRRSSDPSERALAAQVIAYAADKRSVIRELVRATRDPSPEVRNAAMRALGLLALFGRQHPELHLKVPSAPFIDLLSSPIWTDRNKSSMAMMQLTQGRDPRLLRKLRQGAFPALVEMARWKSQGHAMGAFVVLGRVAGLSDDAIFAAWSRGDRESVIRAATKGTVQ